MVTDATIIALIPFIITGALWVYTDKPWYGLITFAGLLAIIAIYISGNSI